MTTARLQAFLNLEPKLPARRLEVYCAGLSRGPGAEFTIGNLSGMLGWGLNRISGRVTELTKAGWFVDTGRMQAGMTLYRIGDGTPLAGKAKDRDMAPGTICEVKHWPGNYGVVMLSVRVKAEDAQRWMVEGATVTVRRRKA